MVDEGIWNMASLTKAQSANSPSRRVFPRTEPISNNSSGANEPIGGGTPDPRNWCANRSSSTTVYAASETDIEFCPMATWGAGKTKYYKTQSKFVLRDHPFGDHAQLRGGLPTLKDILDALNARHTKGAFDKLVDRKVDQEEIGNFLQMIGVSSDEPIEWPAKKRRAKGELARKCRKLASDIERAKWPFGTRMMYADYIEWSELPRILRSYASAWEGQLKRPFRSARTPRNVNIIRLLEYVKNKTGQLFYPEVASLLNATDAVYGWETRDGEERWSEGTLSSIAYRARQKSK